MKSFKLGTALLILTLLSSGCVTMETHLSWLDNSQKIDEDNGHK